MKVPYSWLGELVEGLPPVQELAELLDGLGLPAEAVHSYPGAAQGTVAVLIEALEPAPDSEHLQVARVFDGAARHQVLTGAPNVKVGMVTAFAAPGVRLPAVGISVEVREMAGLESRGVLLSPRELGVHEYAGGLIEFPAELVPGTDLASEWPTDEILELELTPNRADAFSILGVARDLAAKLNLPYRNPAAGVPGGDPDQRDGLTAEVVDRSACPVFTLRRIDGVRVGPSPLWIQRRLASIGIRPRNNVVDVTNFVTFELGQPSHAYDLASLDGGVMQVRRAKAGEHLITLTGDELELVTEDLVIATPSSDEGDEGSVAIGLAGVIGGSEDSVSEGTVSVALEVSHFDPVTIRRTAKRHTVSTDAHYRFERGVDPALPPLASARAAQLIAATAGGEVHPGMHMVGTPASRSPISFRPSRVEFLMDFEVDLPGQRRYLEALGCEVTANEQDSWKVVPPTWRFDLGIEEDLVEEVGRLHGYEHVSETVPAMRFVPRQADPTHRALSSDIAGLGFQESIGYVFTSDSELARSGAPDARVRLQNPQGAERSVLRTALYPNLLSAAQLNRNAPSLALFEVGHVFLEEEVERVALLARGPWIEPGWQQEVELDFFLFKGLLESLAERRNVEFAMSPARQAHLHPGISAEVLWDGRRVGSAGRLHPEIAARYELGDTYLAELDLPLQGRPVRFAGLARQQHAERDISVIAPLAVPFVEVAAVVQKSAGGLLESLVPFDLYTGPSVPDGSRSIAIRLGFRHPERALRDEEVDGYMENVMRALRATGYDIRDR